MRDLIANILNSNAGLSALLTIVTLIALFVAYWVCSLFFYLPWLGKTTFTFLIYAGWFYFNVTDGPVIDRFKK